MHCPLYFSFFLLQFVRYLYSDMLHLLQFLRLASYPKLIKTIVTNLPLHSVKFDRMHSHILPLTYVVQAQFTSLHLTINKCHR